ncbi:MAG: class I SAM-dependent methyltransferase [Caldilineaceae bacterium]
MTVEEIYNESEEEYQALLDAVDESLHPRGPDMLYDKFAGFHPTPNSVVLDLGCRDAAHACELSRRFGCRVVGVDLIDANIARAHRRIADGRLEDRVQVIQGDILQLPLADAMFDFIWCRDVLGHMSDLHLTFATCARVLKPGGRMLNFHVFATEMFARGSG